MSTHCLKLENRVVGIQRSGGITEWNSLGESVQDNFSLLNEPAQSSFLEEKNKTIALLKSQVEVLETELQKAREESHLAGFTEGRNAGHDEVRDKIEGIAEEFALMLRSLKDQYDKSLENMNEPLLELAMKIAEKIIGKELQVTHNYEQVLINQIKRMLNKVVNQNSITIRVHPICLDWVNKDTILSELNVSLKTELNFISDEKLSEGECVLETEDYILDGLLTRQMSNVKDKILGSDAEWID